MALINTLRNKMGKFVVVVIAIAILSFVAADMLGPNSTLLGGPDNNVGEVAGTSIDYEEFQNAVDERKSSFAIYTGQRPGSQQEPMLREQAWELLVARHAYQKEYDALGIEVPEDEEWDMVQGRNIDPTIQGLFRNPQTGQFDREQLMSFLQNKASYPPDYQILWETVYRDIVPGRKRLKYENMLIKGNYITQKEAEKSYHNQNDVAEVRYVYIPYVTVSEEEVTVTDNEMRAYYNEKSALFETEETRSMKYVTFPIVPSSADSAAIFEEARQLRAGFANAQDDSLYAVSQSDSPDAFRPYSSAALPSALKAYEDSLAEGQIYGPVLGFDGYQLFKVNKVHEDTALYDIAKIAREIYASEDTRNIAARKADLFASKVNDMESFEALAKEEGLTVMPSGPLGKNDQRILGLGDARRLIQWLYRDADMGEVSEDEEINDNYVIAVMESRTPAGITPFEQVRADILAELSKDKKAAIIKQKLGAAEGTLDEIVGTYGPDASLYQTSDLRMDANILPNVGFDPAAVGMAFHLGSGQRSEPFAGESGVLIIEVQNVTESPEIADYTAFKQELLRSEQLRTSQNISDAIKEDAGVVDERYKFY